MISSKSCSILSTFRGNSEKNPIKKTYISVQHKFQYEKAFVGFPCTISWVFESTT